MPASQNIVPSSVRLPQALKERLADVCDAKNIKPSAGMVEAIETWVRREEQRVSLRNEAIAAHDHFVASGLHLTGDEANSWMQQLEQGNDVEPPQCHI